MGARLSVIKYFLRGDAKKQGRSKQGLMGFIISVIRCFICRQIEKLRRMKQGLMGLILRVVGCFVSRPVEKPKKLKKRECSLEEIHSNEPSIVTESSGSNTQQQVLVSAATSVDDSEVVEVKKQNGCLQGKLHCAGQIERKQDTCLLEEKDKSVCLDEDQQSEESIEEDVEKREEEVTKGDVAEERWIHHYSSFQKILLVGEGDFSFSASLAAAFGSAFNMIATSLDSRDFLKKNYRNAMSNIENLISRGCIVIHEVNAKKMAKHPMLKDTKFDRVIYNFPFAGFFKTESRESQLGRHRKLVSQFLGNAKEMINETGEIHITHKTNGFHCEWNIEQLASCHGLGVIEVMFFDQTKFPGYSTKCGFGGDDDFHCDPSKTYKFGYRTASTKKKRTRKRRSHNAASSSSSSS